MGTHQREYIAPPKESGLALMGAHQGMMKGNGIMSVSSKESTKATELMQNDIAKLYKDEPILNAANKLLIELKNAYSQILQEKDNEIRQLKIEIAELKTLVKALEFENERIKNR